MAKSGREDRAGGGKESGPLHMVLISYIPMLVGEAGTTFPTERMEDMLKNLDQLPSGNADACLWFKHNIKSETEFDMRPVFLMPNADMIAAHITYWAEGKPEEWFRFHLRQKNGRYAFALIPNFSKSIERNRMAYQLKAGYPIPKDTKYTFIFRAVHFVSGPNNLFLPERHRLADPTEVGFLDLSKVNKDNLNASIANLTNDDVMWVGPFHLAPNKDVLSYLDSLIDDAKEPSKITLKR
jgi:hypothetical protein